MKRSEMVRDGYFGKQNADEQHEMVGDEVFRRKHLERYHEVVRDEGFEPPTLSTSMRCSTPELITQKANEALAK